MTKIKKLTEEDINPDTLNGQTLAYLGDAVYEVIIRRHLVCGGIVKPQVLQREATHYVSAKAQAALVTKMQDEEMLTDDALTACRRGRNAQSHTKAKHTSLKTYQLSTGFEAMIGYLNLLNQDDRVQELSKWCIDTVEKDGLKDYDFE